MSVPPENLPKLRRAVLGCLGIMAIIVTAAAIVFPAPGGLRVNVSHVVAHKDETLIITAVRAYYTEYGKYPIDSSNARGTVVFSTDNNVLFDVLRNCNGATSGNPLNPRGIVFLDVAAARDQNHPKAGIQTSTGIWFDPWGTPYQVAIDASDSGELNGKFPIPGFYSDVGPLKTLVAVWSYGRNGQLGGGPAASSAFTSESGSPGKNSGSGDVVSW